MQDHDVGGLEVAGFTVMSWSRRAARSSTPPLAEPRASFAYAGESSRFSARSAPASATRCGSRRRRLRFPGPWRPRCHAASRNSTIRRAVSIEPSLSIARRQTASKPRPEQLVTTARIAAAHHGESLGAAVVTSLQEAYPERACEEADGSSSRIVKAPAQSATCISGSRVEREA